MGVDSYLELFTTMYGWAFSEILRDIIVTTGLVFVPFGVILVQTWLEAHESIAIEGADASWMVRKMEVHLGCALFVMTMCFVTTPITSISTVKLTYTEDSTGLSSTSSTQVTAANSGSTYDDVFHTQPSVSVPIFWYAVMSLSSGISQAAKAGINSNISGFRKLEEEMRAVSIDDPKLRVEVQRFWNECFEKAHSKYLSASEVSSQVQSAISTYGRDDTEWMGSHAFTTDPKLYPTIFADREVPGWPVDPVQDADVTENTIVPDAGRPNCAQWWSDSSKGLREKLANKVSNVSLTNWLKKANFWLDSDDLNPLTELDKYKDMLAKLGISKSRPGNMLNSLLSTSSDNRSWHQKLTTAGPEVVGMIGILTGGFTASTIMYPLVAALEMAQPIILLAIYMFMPLVLLISGYSPKAMFAGMIAIFTVKMWPFMWLVTRFLDDRLIGAMYPDASSFLAGLVDNPLDFDGILNRSVLNYVFIGFYIGFPAIWTGMMAWAGIRGMHGIGQMQDSAARTGEANGESGIKAVKLGMGKVKK